MRYQNSLAKKIGLLAGSVLFNITAQAQGLELFSITQAEKGTANKSTLSPPRVSVIDNSAQVEQNYNLIRADTTALTRSTQLPLIIGQIQLNRTEYLAAATARNAAAKDSPEQKALQARINELEAANKKLLEDYTRKQKEELASRLVQDEVHSKLLARLHALYEEQLSKLRIDVSKNMVLQRQALDSHAENIKKLRQYQTEYWDKMPELVDIEAMYSSNKAYRAFDRELTTLEQKLKNANASYATFQKAGGNLAAYKLSPTDTTTAARKAYNHQLTTVQQATTDLTAKVDTVRAGLEAYNQKVDKWKGEFKAEQDKKIANENNLTALPALTSIKGSSLFIPAVSLIGSHRGGDINSPNMYSLKLFTALGGTDNANGVTSKRGTERLFISDASTFGFSADALISLKYAERKRPVMGVTLGIAYLDKLMTPDSLHSFTTGVTTARAGLEWYLIPDVLLLYGGVNSLTFLTNRNQITDYYTSTRPKDLYFFGNGGIRAILNVSKESRISFLFDLGFVFKDDNVRKFVPNDDFTITTIRATLAKNFMLR
ncbi:hypothetical protein GCM10023185_10720 [Hymenobacter saemangeumensis]|uniref:Outer membrane protein beta-barrel domain-containing protein n=1 Tax=Hymenobacter saemangeumensis TaxID=1084522 RepID=A0ABP8I5H8_9BACT